MKSTKIAAATLAVAALSLTACSSSGDNGDSGDNAGGGLDGKGKTLNVLVSAKAAFPTEQKEWFQHISDEFEKQTGAKVIFDTFATTADEQKKIQTSTVAGSGPDIYSIGISFTPVADATGAFIGLDSDTWDKLGGRDKFVPAALGESGKTPDAEIAVPFISRPYVLAYNTKMFKEAGIDAPPTTWDEFRDAAKKLTTDGVYGAAVAYADPYDPWKYVWTMSASAGNQVAEGDAARFDDPVLKDAYKAYFGFLTEDHIVDPASTSWKNAQAVGAFAEGKAAMVPMVTPGSYPLLKDSSVKDDWAWAVMPTVPSGATERPEGGLEAASTISGDNMVVADYSPNKDLALELINFMTSKDEQVHYFEVFGELPANAEAAEEVVAQHPEYQPVLDAQALSVPSPYTGAWSEIQISLGDVVVQMLPDLTAGTINESNLDKQLADGQKATQEALDRAKGH